MKRSLKVLFPLCIILCWAVTSTCKKLDTLSSVSTGEVTNFLQSTADAPGKIIDIGKGSIQHGHCYSKTSNVTISDSKTQLGVPSGTGDFVSHLINLDAGTKYYVKAYISDGNKTVYGKEVSFTTLQAPLYPEYTSSAVENATPSVLEMTYSLNLANIVPATSAFTVMINSSARAINTVSVSGTKVQLTLASSVVHGDVVTVAYTKPATNPLQTAAGGQAATITAQSVTNNVSAVLPVFISSAVENATPSVLEMTYSLLLANIVPAATAFTVMVNSSTRTINTVAISGTKVQLTLASPVIYGDIVTVAYTKPATSPLQTAAGGQAATITAQNVTNNVSAVVPVYVSSVVENTTPNILEITYNLTLANIVPAASTFTVMVNSAARTVGSVSVSGTKVQLTLASPVVYGDVVTVAYTKPGTNPLQTAAGGQAITITGQSVTNNVAATLPVYVSSSVENATPSILEMTYNMTMANIAPAVSAFTVMVNSSARTVNLITVSGTKVQLTLSSPVIYGDIVTVAYTKPGTNPLQTATGGQAATITAQNVTNNVGVILPVYVSSAVENSTPSVLELTYNLSLANIVPSASAFTVMVNSVARTVNTVAISGTKVQLTLASAIVYGDAVTVAYTKPGSNPLQTPSGGQAVTITAQSVTNNVGATIPLPVYVSSVVGNATPSILEMTYSITLANIVPAASAFTVQVNSVARTVNTVAISGTKVQLTLASAVIYSNAVTVAYTKPGSNPIQTASGGQAATITAQTVTNNVAAALPVYVSSVVENATPSIVEMTYNLTLANIVPAASAFTVMVNSVARTVSSVTITGAKVRLTLSSAIVVGDVVTVGYTKPATNPLQTSAGGQAADLNAQPVTNTTSYSVPTLTTNSVSSITPISAISGGNITSNGGAVITVSGLCWSTVSNPTVSDNKTTDGALTGSYSSTLFGLNQGTLYYVRAYATNIAGTAYGNQVSFSSLFPVDVPENNSLVLSVESQSVVNLALTASLVNGTIYDNKVIWRCSLSDFNSRNYLTIEHPTPFPADVELIFSLSSTGSFSMKAKSVNNPQNVLSILSFKKYLSPNPARNTNNTWTQVAWSFPVNWYTNPLQPFILNSPMQQIMSYEFGYLRQQNAITFGPQNYYELGQLFKDYAILKSGFPKPVYSVFSMNYQHQADYSGFNEAYRENYRYYNSKFSMAPTESWDLNLLGKRTFDITPTGVTYFCIFANAFCNDQDSAYIKVNDITLAQQVDSYNKENYSFWASTPTKVELGVISTFGLVFSSITYTVCADNIIVSNWKEERNGILNPIDSWDQNPKPIIIKIDGIGSSLAK